MQENGSPRATIETDEERTYFLIDIPCNLDCLGVPTKKDDKKELSDIQLTILSLIENNDKITIPVLARKTGTSERTLSRELKIMREELKVLTREGGRKDGRWVITQS